VIDGLDMMIGDAFVYANGVDARTGGYLLPPMTTAQVASVARSEHIDTGRVGALRNVKNALELKHLGLPFDIDPLDISQAGWAIVFHKDEDAAVKAATLKRFPGCAAFFRLQERCQEAYFGPLAAPSTAARTSAEAELLRTIESIAGCKSIIGFENVCETVREAARGKNLSPRLRSMLQECADESIASRTSSMIRPGL
jgi:hypothetical protein